MAKRSRARSMRSKHQLASKAVDAALQLLRTWGGGIGLVLVEAHYSGDPWISAIQASKRLGGTISDDTARRRLDELVNVGRAEVQIVDSRKVYRCKPELAEQTIELLNNLFTEVV